MNRGTHLYSRRSQEYIESRAVWAENESAFKGGRSHIELSLIRHVSELLPEFEERKKRAHYINYPRAIACRITSYALAVEPTRTNAAPDLVEDFSRTGLRCNDIMRQISTYLTVYGKIWVYVGMPHFDGVSNLEQRQKDRLRPFARVISPLDVYDYAEDESGNLLWAIVAENYYRKDDPYEIAVEAKRVRLWTREKWELWEQGPGGAVLLQSGDNSIGKVPLIPVVEPESIEPGLAHWFNDVVRISNSILNAGSESQMNIIKQMFGLLVVSESFIRGAERMERKDGNGKTEMSGFANVISRSFAAVESKDEAGITRYINSNGAENAAIRAECETLKNEMYEVVGLAMQSRSREAQSSESKSWDFQNVSQFLASRADLLECVERRIWGLMSEWDSLVPVPEITYNRKFAVKDLEKSISGLLQLSTLPNTGVEYAKQILRAGLDQLNELAEISTENYQKIQEEIEGLQPTPVPHLTIPQGTDPGDE